MSRDRAELASALLFALSSACLLAIACAIQETKPPPPREWTYCDGVPLGACARSDECKLGEGPEDDAGHREPRCVPTAR